MESGLRREQVFVRVGGEEFAILYPEVSGEGARVLAERLCSRIAAERIVWAEETLSLTCSFGIAETSETVADDDSPLRRSRPCDVSVQGGRPEPGVVEGSRRVTRNHD